MSFNLTYKSGTFKGDYVNQDSNGFVGLPVTGFWVSRYTNGFAFGDDVLAN
ncbi:MAG: hypothetical protein GWM88_10445, partial [Pseudomonadales bacterium]|nr:hypothetical protein [Pseudomonadales bacterium]NIX08386.1 hypothetical protein [Pseudomonadales bacterium]